MDAGQTLTIWFARASAAGYLLALLLMARRSPHARIVWTTALALYLAHVAGAFEYFYQWSHSVALLRTTEQTAELFGVQWSGGIYLNYLFTTLWTADCLWWWKNAASYRARPRSISVSIHAFMAFMYFNGTITVWLIRALR